MFHIEIQAGRKLLHLSFSGSVGVEEARRCAEEATLLVSRLPSEFRLLTDLSGLELMEVACAPYVERLMDVCNRHGVATVVRVIPDPHKDIGMNIMSLFHYRRRVRIITCETLPEAENVLGQG